MLRVRLTLLIDLVIDIVVITLITVVCGARDDVALVRLSHGALACKQASGGGVSGVRQDPVKPVRVRAARKAGSMHTHSSSTAGGVKQGARSRNGDGSPVIRAPVRARIGSVPWHATGMASEGGTGGGGGEAEQ